MNTLTSIWNSLLKAQEYFMALDWYWQLILTFCFVMLIASAIANLLRRDKNG